MRAPSEPGALDRESGAAAVEFALVVTILILLVFGIAEFGRVSSEIEVLNGAAREGARVAAVRATNDEIEDRVRDAADPYEVDGAISIIPEQCDDTNQGEAITVSWTEPMDIQIPLFREGAITNFDVPIRGVFRCE